MSLDILRNLFGPKHPSQRIGKASATLVLAMAEAAEVFDGRDVDGERPRPLGRYLTIESRTAYYSPNHLFAQRSCCYLPSASASFIRLNVPGAPAQILQKKARHLSNNFQAISVSTYLSVCATDGQPQQNAFRHRMHPSLLPEVLSEIDESSLSSGSCAELPTSEEDSDSKLERTSLKLKRMLGLGHQEVDIYETIQAYRNGKPQQVFGQIPQLDELVELQAHTNDIRIQRILEQSKLNKQNAQHQDDKKSSKDSPSKTAKIFGVNQEDLQMQKAHPKPSKVFGEPPPAAAFVNSPKHVKILLTE